MRLAKNGLRGKDRRGKMQTEKGEERFLELFTGMCEMFDKKYSDILLGMYYEALKQYEISKVEDAINLSIISCKFFPKPVDLLENLGGGKQALEDTAQIQASEVLKAISRHGSYESIDFEDKISQAVIVDGFGGWVRMCQELLSKDEKWWRKDFAALYSAFSRQGRTHPGVLSGRHEIDNQARGLKEKIQINYIGEKPKEIE